MRRQAFAYIMAVILSGPALAATDPVKAYNAGDYDGALTVYNDVLRRAPEDPQTHFNIGCALFQKGDFETALDHFNRALLSDDPAVEAGAYYNIGNTKYRIGRSRKQTDPGAAIGLYRDALEYYKKAIEAHERHEDAQFNHELVERELKALLDEQQKRQQEAKDKKQEACGEQNEEQEGEQNDSGDDSMSRPDQEQEQEPQTAEEKKEESEKTEEKQEGREKEDAGRSDSVSRSDQQTDMSEEEARRLLEQFAQREQEQMLQQKAGQPGRTAPVYKDW